MRGIAWVLLCAACSGAEGQQVRPLPPSLPPPLPSPAHSPSLSHSLLQDACGCAAGFGWSITTGRGCCKPGSNTQPAEIAGCQVLPLSLYLFLASRLTQRLLGGRRPAGTPTAR